MTERQTDKESSRSRQQRGGEARRTRGRRGEEGQTRRHVRERKVTGQELAGAAGRACSGEGLCAPSAPAEMSTTFHKPVPTVEYLQRH